MPLLTGQFSFGNTVRRSRFLRLYFFCRFWAIYGNDAVKIFIFNTPFYIFNQRVTLLPVTYLIANVNIQRPPTYPLLFFEVWTTEKLFINLWKIKIIFLIDDKYIVFLFFLNIFEKPWSATMHQHIEQALVQE